MSVTLAPVDDPNGRWGRTFALTGLSMMAFASNSLLCRAALDASSIDPLSFSSIRIAAGALALWLILTVRRTSLHGSWRGAVYLFLYAVPFSLSYVSLSTGTGALILFGLVQVTMFAAAVRGGERPRRAQWWGTGTALVGLVALVLPGLRAPSPTGAGLMAVAGVSWGLYSLAGRGTQRPLAMTAGNFVRAIPLSLAVNALGFGFGTSHGSLRGVLLAVVSGALTSGIGYALWYAALRHLRASTAATVQLTVPILASILGLIVLSEEASTRLILSSVLILGGVGSAIWIPGKEATGGRNS